MILREIIGLQEVVEFVMESETCLVNSKQKTKKELERRSWGMKYLTP